MMNLDERDDTNDSSLGTPGEEPRATMVPPTSLSTYVSISITGPLQHVKNWRDGGRSKNLGQSTKNDPNLNVLGTEFV